MTLPESGEACAAVLALRQALGTARRRDILDADLRAAETELARLPPVTAADPQADRRARAHARSQPMAIRPTERPTLIVNRVSKSSPFLRDLQTIVRLQS